MQPAHDRRRDAAVLFDERQGIRGSPPAVSWLQTAMLACTALRGGSFCGIGIGEFLHHCLDGLPVMLFVIAIA